MNAYGCFMWLWILVLSDTADKVQDEDDGYRAPHEVDESLPKSFVPPRLGEEHELGQHFPAEMLCDACQAVAYRIHMGFVWAHRYKKEVLLTDMEILEAVEETCEELSFLNLYGLGFNSTLKRPVLIGPGSPHGHSGPPQGEIAAGGSVPKRLSAICNSFLDMPDHYEFPEKIIYQHWIYFRAEEGLSRFLCYDPADEHRSLCLRPEDRHHDYDLGHAAEVSEEVNKASQRRQE